MGRRLKSMRVLREMEDSENSPESSGDSPRAAVSKDAKSASTSAASSSNRSRRSIQKKVVSVPIKDVQRLSAPPPDSWAWRKYGQKPIKGSPYPRGYYRCSSSKGCPARKQVERNKLDPDMIMVTYSCEHNHPSPVASRSNLNRISVASKNGADSVSEDYLEEEDDEEEEEEREEMEERNPNDSIACKSNDETQKIPEEKPTHLVEAGTLINGGEFEWYADFEDSTMLESPILMDDDDRIAADTVFTKGGEDDSLFADLGELPECSRVFRRGMAAEQRQHSMATTTG